MSNSQHRHDIFDRIWNLLQPHLPGQRGQWGGIGFDADHVIADKGYDSDDFVEHLKERGIKVEIPPRKNRKEKRSYDKHLYRHRHLVENALSTYVRVNDHNYGLPLNSLR